MYATKIAVFTSGSSSLLLEDGNPVWLHNIVIANSSGAVVDQTFTWKTDGVGGTVTPSITVPINDTAIWHGVDTHCQGLTLGTVVADVTITITYRMDG